MKFGRLLIVTAAASLIAHTASAGPVGNTGQALSACKAHLAAEGYGKVKMKKALKRRDEYRIILLSKKDGSKEKGACTVNKADGSVSYVAN